MEEFKKSLEHILNDFWKKEYGTYPKVPWDEDVDPILYLSSSDEEEYVYWKPIEKVT
ncbi:hypothetical protein [Metabacillus sp. Hm71]|uniref:hypothetical protein n=1 Tax=Metabacillus sp. Hm71 TaxID=3450743 RepID=UPI003F4443D5